MSEFADKIKNEIIVDLLETKKHITWDQIGRAESVAERLAHIAVDIASARALEDPQKESLSEQNIALVYAIIRESAIVTVPLVVEAMNRVGKTSQRGLEEALTAAANTLKAIETRCKGVKT